MQLLQIKKLLETDLVQEQILLPYFQAIKFISLEVKEDITIKELHSMIFILMIQELRHGNLFHTRKEHQSPQIPEEDTVCLQQDQRYMSMEVGTLSISLKVSFILTLLQENGGSLKSLDKKSPQYGITLLFQFKQFHLQNTLYLEEKVLRSQKEVLEDLENTRMFVDSWILNISIGLRLQQKILI